MEERVGAYIIDSEGKAVPDLTDEAMAARRETRDEGRETRDVNHPSSVVHRPSSVVHRPLEGNKLVLGFDRGS